MMLFLRKVTLFILILSLSTRPLRYHVIAFQTTLAFASPCTTTEMSYRERQSVLFPSINQRPLPSSCSSSKHRSAPPSTISTSLRLMFLSDAVVSSTPADNANILAPMTTFQNIDFWVFVAGVFPFAWATVEFWRRIMFGEPFGTGKDSVIIGMDDAPSESRGRRVLGRGALITAYVLFVIAFGTIGIVLYSVLSSPPLGPDDLLPSSQMVSTR
jgi:hypothetical protein